MTPLDAGMPQAASQTHFGVEVVEDAAEVRVIQRLTAVLLRVLLQPLERYLALSLLQSG